MTFKLIPKFQGKPFGDLNFICHGSMKEGYERALKIVQALDKLFHKRTKKDGFTVRVDRVDKPAEGYEIGADGHTLT